MAPVAVEVKLNGHRLGTLAIAEAIALHELAVPKEALASGKNQLELAYARTAQPRATMKGSEDARALAVRYDWLALAPAN